MLTLQAAPYGPSPLDDSGTVARLTPKTMVKFALAVALFGAGMHYLVAGRKEANFSKMLTGALLVLACLLCL